MTKRLARFAEMAGIDLALVADDRGLRFRHTGKYYFVLNWTDRQNAEFIIWGLARLEELGYEWTIRTRANRNGITGYHLTCAKFRPSRSFDAQGKTLAETVFNALYMVLEDTCP